MKDNILKHYLGISFVIISLAFFMNSLSPATASNNDNLYENGRYMMQYQAEYSDIDDKTKWYVLVWDTQTGKSTAYYSEGSTGWRKSISSYQLPSNPLD